jgi:hypothetical protein
MDKETVESVVVIVGIVIGSLTMLSAIWVWARKQQFGYAGTLLSFFGTLLIGLSVFSKAQISVGEVEVVVESLKRDVANLEQENESIARENSVISSEFLKLARSVDLQRGEFLKLGNVLARTEPSLRAPVDDARELLLNAERPNIAAIQEVVERDPHRM